MYEKPFSGWMKHLDFMVMDLFSLEFAFFCSYWVRYGLNNPYGNPQYRNMGIALGMIQILVCFFRESFKNVLKRGHYREFADTFKHVCTVILVSIFYLFLNQQSDIYIRNSILLTGMLYMILSYILRECWKELLKRGRFSRRENRSMVIITTRSMANTVIRSIRKKDDRIYKLAGIVVFDQDMQGQTVDGVPVIANRDNILEYTVREWVDEVFIHLPGEIPFPEELMDQLIAMGIAVHLRLAKIVNLRGQKQEVECLGNDMVLTASINMATARQYFCKRTMDILGGIVGCIATGLLCILLVPAIYLQSPGPVFFSQIRIGKNGRKFKMYKFRSMYMDAEERKAKLMEENQMKNPMMFKMKDDPRIIGGTHGIGGFIRKHSLDEFPQFYNVLKGDMSLVGTRPPTEDEWKKYDLHHRTRLAVRPGITGMWQVNGRSNIQDFEEVVKLDTQYIQEWSIGLDIKIIWKTLGTIVKVTGAM